MSGSKRGLSARLLSAAGAVLLSVILLSLAVWLLERIWVWLLVIALMVVAVWIGIAMMRARSRRGRWWE